MFRPAILISLGLALLQTPASAQNCEDPQFQQEMNYCSHQDFLAADEKLNAAYKTVRAKLREWDADLPENLKGGADALRDAQRAWITYRDKACEAEGFLFRGGTMEPLIVSSCKTRLTERRTDDMLIILE